ncbi:MAG: rhodanese-like domain-containing protein [Leptolyngbyaceae cyanobacterium MO_188.B28]|nr:rhodanese-like domain-containing protein [Leptolyngbyaceae cyanobacterium MO_188.B28]
MLIPIPAALQAKSSVYDLKERLDWGEPALTIIDVRSKEAFNACHITGAVSWPLSQMNDQAALNLNLVRDIYVYGASDQESAAAIASLNRAGYRNVAEIKGGLTAWKVAGFPTEGAAAVVA